MTPENGYYGARVLDGNVTTVFVNEQELADRTIATVFRAKKAREDKQHRENAKRQNQAAKAREKRRAMIFDVVTHVSLGIGILLAASQSLAGLAFAVPAASVCFIWAAIRADRFNRRAHGKA